MADRPSAWQGELDRDDLTEQNAPANPLALFSDWYAEAQTHGMIEPTAMTLATVDDDGAPSARIVLLKGADDRGFRFYSNYHSRKGQALAANPAAALVFWWEASERQVRVTGQVSKLPATESDAYFANRSRGSQLGAHASPQSQILSNRTMLSERLADAERHFADQAIQRPEHWGGYILTPQSIEFWQARRSRLHDRLRYRRHNDVWQIERLAP